VDLETRTIRILCATDYEYWLRFLQVYRKIKQAEVFLRHCVGTAREMDGETESATSNMSLQWEGRVRDLRIMEKVDST